MATRFYFEVDGPGNVPSISPAFDAGWESNAGNRRFMHTNRHGISAGTKSVTPTGANPSDRAYLQLHSRPLAAQTITGTLSGIIRVNEVAATDNYFAALVARVLSADGATVRGTLLSSLAGAGTEFPTTSATVFFPTGSPAALSSVTAQEGDIIVIEFGVTESSTSVNNAGMVVGDGAATDYALTEGLTTLLNPWFEFSQDLIFPFSGPRARVPFMR